MLELNNLSIEYASQLVVQNISCRLEQERTLGIIGKSGCGKSTLLAAIAGTYTQLGFVDKFAHPTVSGDILWRGQSILGKIGHASIMHQEQVLLPWLHIIDNIALPLRVQGIKKARAREIALSFLKEFNMASVAGYYPAQLSGGMQQRIALLRTCIKAQHGTSLVLLDEPFAKLDLITKQQCRDWARDILNVLKATVVLVTHDVEEAILFSDEIIVLKEGDKSAVWSAKNGLSATNGQLATHIAYHKAHLKPYSSSSFSSEQATKLVNLKTKIMSYI